LTRTVSGSPEPVVDTVQLALPLALVLALAAPHILIIHNDLGWHLRSGELILMSQGVPRTDPWSINTHGFPWLNSSWGWDCITWICYRLAGLTGLLCVSALLSAVLVRLVSGTGETAGAKAAAATPVGLWMLLALLTYELPEAPVSIAPQTTTLLLLAMLQYRLQTDEARRQPWWGPLLFIAWGNLHGGFVAGQLAVVATLGERILRFGRAGLVREGLLAVACLAAPVISPYGIDNYVYVLRHLSSPASGVILEWLPYSIWQSALASTFILGFLASLVHRPVRHSGALVTQSVIWLALGLQHQRNIALFLVSAAPLIAVAASSLFRAEVRPLVPRSVASSVSVFLILASPAIVKSQFSGPVEWPTQMYPKQEIAYLVEHLDGRRLYNHWNFGSFIIFDTAGQVPVFIDGRGATAYPPELLQEMRDLSVPQILDKHSIDVALIPLYNKSLVADLDGQPEWERELTGPTGVVYRRKAAPQ
jgi:hypothetical protein